MESKKVMANRPKRDPLAERELEQMAIQFPDIKALLEKRTMDNAIYPPKKNPAADLVSTEPQSMAVAKGMHVIGPRRKA